MISVTKTNIAFSSTFRDNYELKPYITLYQDDDGFLCFILSDESDDFSYKVTRNKVGGYFFRKPTFLMKNNRMPIGKFNVIQRDGYFVTDCKLNLEEEWHLQI